MQRLWMLAWLIILVAEGAAADSSEGFVNVQTKDLDADPALIATSLKSSDPAVRTLAYEAAVRLGPPMVAPLLDILSQGGAVEVHTAQMALTRIVGAATAPEARRQAEEVRQALLICLRRGGDNNDRARTVATQLLGIIGVSDRSTGRTLRDAVLGGGSVSAAALEAMQRIPGRRITEALIDTLRRTEPSSQVPLILALGARQDTRALPELSRLTEKESGETQVAALQALGLLRSARAVPLLRAVAQSGSESSRKAAVDALLLIADARELDGSMRSDILHTVQNLAVTEAQKAAAEAGLKNAQPCSSHKVGRLERSNV